MRVNMASMHGAITKAKQKIVWWQLRGLLHNLCMMFKHTLSRVCKTKSIVVDKILESCAIYGWQKEGSAAPSELVKKKISCPLLPYHSFGARLVSFAPQTGRLCCAVLSIKKRKHAFALVTP